MRPMQKKGAMKGVIPAGYADGGKVHKDAKSDKSAMKGVADKAVKGHEKRMHKKGKC